MARIGKLSKGAQLFVVRKLAQWETLGDVVAAVKEVYGIGLSRQSVYHYNPEANPNLAEWLKIAFAAERKRFTEEIESNPLAHLSYRLNQLLRIFLSAKSPSLQAALLRQAAEEMGGAYTDRLRVEGGILTKETVSTLLNRVVGVVRQNVPDEEVLERIGQGIAEAAVEATGAAPRLQG
jgi:hypothetical protein